jgi:NAD(P)-dependent dehydrogenase (short-subunit alcohol dehydrogenase family)
MTSITGQSPRVAVITGASSGIGLSAARTLASQGWRIIGTGRDPQRTAMAATQLKAAARPGVGCDMIRVDLALLADAARAADQIRSLTDRVDVLINNAGGTARERVITSEGNEATFAGNHLGHFVLTRRLLPLLQRSAADAPSGATRIINVSSRAHETAPGLDWNDLQMIEHFVPIKAYCNAKLANLLFTRVLSERLAGDGIVAHAMHPGIVDSNFINHADDGTKGYLKTMPMVSPDEAADTLVWLATAAEPGATTNGYYYQRQTAPTTDAAKDGSVATRLWHESEQLAGSALASRP